MKKVLFRFILLLAVVGGVYGSYRYFQQLPQKTSEIAFTKVRKGDVVVRAFTRGELRAVRSVTLTAPNLFSTVQVTKLASLGAVAKEKDLIVEFDDSERRSQLEETLLQVEQIDEQIKKSQADLEIRNNQDQVDLLKARYSVRRAELEVQRNELLSPIDAKKNLLNLEEAKRRLLQLESDIKSRSDQAQAELAVLRENRNKSLIDVSRERQRIAQCKVLSPITGMVAIRQNRGSFMGSFGQQVPDIREGDTLQPGAQVADVLDISEFEILAKVGELDRANLREGQEINYKLDAVPEKLFHGRIKSMSATATSNPFGGDPGKKFDVVFGVDMKELLSGLGAPPEQIRELMAQAEQNAKKAPAAPLVGMMMMGGGMPAAGGGMAGGGAMPGGMAGGVPGGGMPGGMPGGAPGMQPGGGRPGGQMSDEQRKAMFAKMLESLPPDAKKVVLKMIGKKKVEELSGDERRALFAKIRELTGQGGGGGRQPQGDPLNPKPTQADIERENAKLPLAPEEDNQLKVLLRPGLLADIEIIVERIPDAINIPNQAVFDKDGKTFVYVLGPKGFDAREVKLSRRSESLVVVASGLKPGESIAMTDPYAKKEEKKKKDDKGSGSKGPASPMSGGGKGR